MLIICCRTKKTNQKISRSHFLRREYWSTCSVASWLLPSAAWLLLLRRRHLRQNLGYCHCYVITVVFLFFCNVTLSYCSFLGLMQCTVMLRANTSFFPRLSAAIFVCPENLVKMRVFCIMANFMLYIGTHSIGTCASLLTHHHHHHHHHHQTPVEDLQWM